MSHYDPTDPTARVSDHRVEVPGDPEIVWKAIATGPGIATWFVPAQVEERKGGRIVTDHGPYGTSEGVVTVWEPPHRFAYEERRFITLGLLKDTVITIVHSETDEEIRIISMRKATSYEQAVWFRSI